MELAGVFKTSASALEAQRERMNVVASNLANVHTTRTEQGGPYKRRDLAFQVAPVGNDPGTMNNGVRVSEIVEDQTPPTLIYDPTHPDANPEGYVAMPNVNVIEEMVNMMMASRAYEANVSAFNISKSMYLKTLEIGR
ncbi:flagellar basal body rod protein FlgC [Candidatus Magnetominusculus xianensis]|uniref:Flagellar basal-body rod protein FlgC n=1 Tax=Candidatus Magnetominusculus xianensis TaxID=1748249 RepID=A0ABR5SEY3_9BACT|nr:flagellar basal body rod protein FlgC [Candidatus Magnetominusculus xianensis]KWT85142.1 flagellar basal body rod protein FlgC [Candidatus Magnetominusculus xianensis]MBF0405400.1 flagellar basal body rod protein FlgC [Nitrospirota bacterium]